MTRTTPAAGNVTVAPGTEMLFEAAATEYAGDYIVAEWTVDGEPGTAVGAFQTEYGQEGEAFSRQTFEEPGPHTVNATLVDANGDTVGSAEWTVTVERGGNEAPEVAGATVDGSSSNDAAGDEPLSVDRTANFSVAVADPDGDLHRVVWFLGMADVRLGTSSVNGSADTASVTVDDPCETCPVFVWVVDESGAVTERTVGSFEGASRANGGAANASATH